MSDLQDPRYKLVYSDQGAQTGGPKRAPGKSLAWLRYERKGRAGKAVTIIDRLALSDDELNRFCQEIKRACGVGGTVKEHHIELQGDCRERVRPMLQARGYKISG